MGLFQFARSWIEIFALIFLDDGAEGYIPRMVVDTTTPTAEDIILVKVGDDAAVVGLDVDVGGWDGPALGSGHDN